MQFIRTLVWRFISLLFIGLTAVALVPQLVGTTQESNRLPREAILAMYVAFAFGYLMKFRILQIPATLTHEVGHALAASLVGGRVAFIRVEHDTSGVTYSTGQRGRITSAFVSAGGPLANAAFFALTSTLVVQKLAYLWVAFTLLATVSITISTVRNFWGWISAAIVTVVLWQSLMTSLQLTSNGGTASNLGIWSTSAINLAVVATAYSAGNALRYSIAVRNALHESQDEYKFARALRLHPRVGGLIILLLNIFFIFWGMSEVLGWSHFWTPTTFL